MVIGGLRLMVYDRTCSGWAGLPGLTTSWRVGGALYQRMGRLDAYYGAASWDEAFAWLAAFTPKGASADLPISEVQVWGHGKWGSASMGTQLLDAATLEAPSPDLKRVAARFLPESLWWFRTCETFGAQAGHAFASSCAAFFHCGVAGHTYIIGPWQSGLHVLSPGTAPDWPLDEGLLLGSPQAPRRAIWSHRNAPNTLHCLQGRAVLERMTAGGI